MRHALTSFPVFHWMVIFAPLAEVRTPGARSLLPAFLFNLAGGNSGEGS